MKVTIEHPIILGMQIGIGLMLVFACTCFVIGLLVGL